MQVVDLVYADDYYLFPKSKVDSHESCDEVLKIQNRKISANLNYFGTKMFLMF